MELTDWLIRLMSEIIQTAVWMVPLIAGIIMVKRGGERPERFFLAGSALMVLDHLVTLVRRVHTQLIMTMTLQLGSESIKEMGARVTSVNIIYTVFTSLFFLAGMVLLVYAFWLKFKKNAETLVRDSAT